MKTVANLRVLPALKWLSGFIKPYIKIVFLNLVSVIIIVIFNIFQVHTIQKLINTTLMGQFEQVKGLIPLLVCGVAVGILSTFVRDYCVGKFTAYTIRDIKNSIMQAVIHMEVSSKDKIHSGDVLSRMANEVAEVERFTSSNISNYLSQPLMFLVSFIYLFQINKELLLVSVFFFPAIVLLIERVSKKMANYREHHYNMLGQANSVIQDTIQGIVTVKMYSIQKDRVEKAQDKLVASQNFNIKSSKIYYAVILPCFIVMNHFPRIVCILFGGYLAITDGLDVGGLFAFVWLLDYIIGPMKEVPDMIRNAYSFAAASKRIREILNLPKERQTGFAFPAANQEPVMQFLNVSFQYNDSAKVLHDINFSIQKSGLVGIVGASGSGKSTMLHLISGFYPCNQGQIRLFGQGIEKWNIEEYRKNIALVNQESYLFPCTIEENIRHGNEAASIEQVLEAAKAVHAHEFISVLPDAYQTNLGEQGLGLSGGQKQRLSLARALLKDTPILLLDEPTSALDIQSEMQIKACLEKLKLSKTVIVVAHRLSTLEHADMIIVLKEGRIVETGTHAELYTLKGEYHGLYSKQMENKQKE